jgi:hypothetical protein
MFRLTVLMVLISVIAICAFLLPNKFRQITDGMPMSHPIGETFHIAKPTVHSSPSILREGARGWVLLHKAKLRHEICLNCDSCDIFDFCDFRSGDRYDMCPKVIYFGRR